MAVLDSGDSGWHVPGWNSGIVQIVFRQDHTAGKIRRIFRLDGHMRKRRILPWHNRNQPDLTGDRQGEYRCWYDIRFFVLGMIVFRMATAEEKGEGKKVRMRFGEGGGVGINERTS